MSRGSLIVSPIVEDQLDSNNSRIPVETKQSKDNAAISAFGFPVFVTDGLLKAYRWNAALLNSEFNKTIETGIASVGIVDGSAVQLSTGAQTNSAIEIQSKTIHRYTSGRGQKIIMSIVLGDTGVSGNLRQWGYGDDQNGAFIRLNGTTLSFVLISGGVEVVNIDASTWDIPISPDANGHLWYIQFEWLGVGDYFIYYDEKLVHTYNFLGTSTVPSMENPDLPISFKNENTTNATNVILKNICSAVSSEGRNLVELTDENNNTARFTLDQKLRTQSFGTSLMSENFANDVYDTTNRWTETIVSGATQTVTNSILNLNVTTAAGSSISEFYNTGLQESVGAICEYNVRLSYGSSLEANNVREWGYLDEDDNDGVYFRLTGSSLSLVKVLGGVQTVEDLSGLPTSSEFNTYTIDQLGVDDLTVLINDQQIFRSTGTALVGNKVKRPFFRMFNNAALAGVPSPTQIEWINLIDSSGQSTVIVGKDPDGIPREAAFDQSGNLKTVAVVTAPPDTTVVTQTAKGSMSGTQDLFYTITSGKSLTIQRLSGGAETSNSGHIIELYEDPTGTGTPLNIIEDIYVNGSSDQKDLFTKFTGDGTRRILLRRRAFGGGTNEVSGVWQGFEQ